MSNISEPAIVVRNVSKKYRLFESERDRLKEALHPFSKNYHKEFWALQEISFEVLRGQTVGILGGNGSGKSTLLQIIAGIMQQTSGEVIVNGRISALLELGAGFNPDFTGRENSIFQAEVVGLSRKEIEKRIPEIEKFADIGEFFDQPVKTYSSGMFVRVAFAAAINIDPDILIIDEALSVGDAKFQNKCFQKLNEFKEKMKTIILVTHDMESVTRLCDYAVLLEHGRVVKKGKPNEITNIYFDILFGDGATKLIKSIGNYNILALRGTYYALPHALGEVNPYTADYESLEGVVIGKSMGEIETLLKKSIKTNSISEVASHGLENKLEIFLESIPIIDNCINRRSYNENESRTGDKRAEILDYLLIRDDDYDPVEIKTWDNIKIYIKILFHQFFQLPVYGFTIKTIDGIKIFGTNTWLDKIDIPPVSDGEVVNFCYEIKMSISGGDFFVTLAIANRLENQIVLADHRTDLIHIRVQLGKEGDNGFVDMDTKSQSISKNDLTKKIILA